MGSKHNFNRFLLLWAGELVSSIGGGLTSFGLGVYVFGQTGSAANMALITLLAFLPTLILSVPAGVLADHYDRRLLMMLGDGCSAAGIFFILVCMLSGKAGLTEICIGVTISSVFSSLLEPSYRATVTDLLEAEEYSKASGMVSLAGSARYLISRWTSGITCGSRRCGIDGGSSALVGQEDVEAHRKNVGGGGADRTAWETKRDNSFPHNI